MVFYRSNPVVTFLGSVVAPPIFIALAVGMKFFAQAEAPEMIAGWAQVLVNVGVAGYMLWWFSNRMERRSEEHSRVIAELRDAIRELKHTLEK